MPASLSIVSHYHDGTKHHFARFARSIGYLDWASQPSPFRSFAGAPIHSLWPAPDAASPAGAAPGVSYRQLLDRAVAPQIPGARQVGDLLRHAFGLSAWKQFGTSRWSLRVNPSSGNLHPTEAYLVCGPLTGISASPAVYHYAADRHAIERRCSFDRQIWVDAGGAEAVLIALTSIHWRESWKYGERAFRYCQHDVGHAMAAVTISAAMLGWRAVLLPQWSHGHIARITGVARDEDFVEAEREDPACVLALVRDTVPEALESAGGRLAGAVEAGEWSGRANQLSEDHVQWTFIDDVATATADPGRQALAASSGRPAFALESTTAGSDARSIILQRRSAVAFDGRTTLGAAGFFGMLSRLMPIPGPPWDALWWSPRVHLLLFVHRVDTLPPGLYLLGRETAGLARLRRAITRDFLWEPVHPDLPLMRLAAGDCRDIARRLSCDQEIAADGFFSFGMIAELDASLDEFGPSFYRHLFWECGVIGQAMYLDAEASGARATGIGCYYDDPVHETLGLDGHAFQSLYHFTVGAAVEDHRLTTQPGYPWENS